ncbi:MAG: hypothetical protein MJ219_00460 [Mycoplasmoidaceae bacterium]|nr:hypothetical protein [Mycoplasmoidaceae bacterium]
MKNFSDDENLCKCFGPYKRGNNCMLIMNLLRGNKSYHDFLYEKRNMSFNEELTRLNPLFETTVDIFEEYDQDMPLLTYIVSRY